MKRGYILLILIIFSCSLVFANGSGNVAYIIKNRPDSGFLYIFNEMGLNVDLINSKKIYATDFSSYDFIFIGDERFRNAADIPIGTFPSVIVNKHHGLEFGITNAGGISQLASNSVLDVKKNSDMIQVYTQENYGIGKPAIPYYYLPNKYKNSEMISIATTNIGYKPELGDVVAYSDVGQANKCFFGVRETKFWTDETKRLFKECVEFAMQGSPTHFVHDVGIVEDYTNSVNGIRIKDLETEEYLLDSISQLECNKKYKIDFKTMNYGDFVEDVEFFGMLNGFNWTSQKNGLEVGSYTSAGSKTINITFIPGFYSINIFAEITDDINPLDNSRSRQIEIICPPKCGDGECNGDETCDTCPEDCGICEPVDEGDADRNGGDGCGEDGAEIELFHDVGIVEDYGINVNGIRIKDIESGEYLNDTISRLECNKKYKIDFKTMNYGDFVEDVEFFGMLNGFNWTSQKNGLEVDSYTYAGSKTINITFIPGFYNLEIWANILNDNNLSNNYVSRQVEVYCIEPVDVEGDLVGISF